MSLLNTDDTLNAGRRGVCPDRSAAEVRSAACQIVPDRAEASRGVWWRGEIEIFAAPALWVPIFVTVAFIGTVVVGRTLEREGRR